MAEQWRRGCRGYVIGMLFIQGNLDVIMLCAPGEDIRIISGFYFSAVHGDCTVSCRIRQVGLNSPVSR